MLTICVYSCFYSYFQGKVQEYLQDLYSGKLHREFHYGPDQEEEKVNNNKKKNFYIVFEDFFGCLPRIFLFKICFDANFLILSSKLLCQRFAYVTL